MAFGRWIHSSLCPASVGQGEQTEMAALHDSPSLQVPGEVCGSGTHTPFPRMLFFLVMQNPFFCFCFKEYHN